MMVDERAEFIDTVDVNELRSAIRWFFMRPFAPRLAQVLELGRYVRELLRTGRWSRVHLQPHVDHTGAPSRHVFDVYGVPARTA